MTPRRVAARLLAAVERWASPASQEWATAMLRELEYVDGEWASLWWALGGATALVRHELPRYVGRPTVGLLVGAILTAGLMAVWLLAVVQLPNMSWSQLSHSSVLERMLAMIALETICIVVATLLWRRRRMLATGALVAGTALFLHVVTYGRG